MSTLAIEGVKLLYGEIKALKAEIHEETNVMSIKIKTPVFSLTMDATLNLIEDENGNPVISINGINPSPGK